MTPTNPHQPPTSTTADTTSSAMTPSAQHKNFPRFRHLPLELRLIIWELCLPQRIIPLSVLALAHSHLPRHTTSTSTTLTATATPTSPGSTQGILDLLHRALAQPRSCVIALVCREARSVALSRRRRVGELDLAWMGEGNWFDPRTDTLLVDCDVFGRYQALWEELQRKLLSGRGFGRQGRGRRGGEVVSVALGGGVVDWMRLGEGNGSDGSVEGDEKVVDGEGGSDAGGEDAGRRIRRREWPVVVSEILLYNIFEDDDRSGLFGLFGEERAVLIELSDERQLARLAGLQASRGEGGIQRTVSRALERWKNESGRFREASRALGLDGDGPYPVIKVELVDSRSVARRGRGMGG